MSTRFGYVRYDSVRAEKQASFRMRFEELESMAMLLLPEGRARSLFLTALEEAYMWTGKALRDEQIEHDGTFVEEKLRGEEGVNVAPK